MEARTWNVEREDQPHRPSSAGKPRVCLGSGPFHQISSRSPGNNHTGSSKELEMLAKQVQVRGEPGQSLAGPPCVIVAIGTKFFP